MIIVGLGNPGPDYVGTRHNLGFAVLDELARRHDASWRSEHGVRWTSINGHTLVQPQEFMNVSGTSLKKFLSYKKIAATPAEFVVVHDELDLPLGTLREEHNRSSAGHNGVQSVIDAFGTQEFSRLRLGIDARENREIPGEAYVLQHVPADELPAVHDMVSRALELLERRLQ